MNYFLEALKKYAEFDGRASRKEFWFFVLFNMIICSAIQIITGRNSMLLQLYQLIIIVPIIALAIRRMHDIGKQGWFILIPIYNIILYCKAGDSLINKYGTKPQELK